MRDCTIKDLPVDTDWQTLVKCLSAERDQVAQSQVEPRRSSRERKQTQFYGLLGEPSRSVSGLIFPSILPTLDAVSIIALGLLNSKAVFWIIQVCTYSVNLVEWYTEIVDDLVIN
ncbi:hypothetical protein QYM36_001703, partial [Artemia franciscana]